jgi:hypothetical protein
VVNLTPLPLYPRHPLARRLGGPQSRSGRCGEGKNLALPGIKPGPSSSSLYRLSYPDSWSTIMENHIPNMTISGILRSSEETKITALHCLFNPSQLSFRRPSISSARKLTTKPNRVPETSTQLPHLLLIWRCSPYQALASSYEVP